MNADSQADRAWVRVTTRLTPAALIAFCQDAERLLRINSMYEFEQWRAAGDGRFFMAVRNLSTGQGFATHMRIEPCVDGLRIAYATGLKTATQFRVEADDTDTANGGSVLIVTDDYSGTPAAERHARAGEIDKSIVWWGHDLHRYLKHWALCSRFRAWRWYMSRVWQPMKPQARRITFMLIAITIFELLAGAVAVAIFAFAEW